MTSRRFLTFDWHFCFVNKLPWSFGHYKILPTEYLLGNPYNNSLCRNCTAKLRDSKKGDIAQKGLPATIDYVLDYEFKKIKNSVENCKKN